MPVEGVVARMMRAGRYVFGGSSNGWMGPGQPITPSAPKEAVEGRSTQYPVAVNTQILTKGEGIGYAALRSMADTTDIVRLLIELRKDQLKALQWGVQKRGQSRSVRGRSGASDATTKRLEAFFESPDRENPFQEWLSALLEDMYVIDAATIYIQRTRGGQPYALRAIDGATIKRLIDEKGYTPPPPAPAYQQILYGTVAADYTSEDMLFRRRNVRTNKLYGFSHVEQIVVTAKTWLARQASNLEYYDAGSVPDGFLSAHKDWTTQEIKLYDDLMNVRLSGQIAERKKVVITPWDSKFTQTKQPALMDPFDEWLARIACFAFSVPPTPFVKQMNRATADTANISSLETGLGRDKVWVQQLLSGIIASTFGQPDYEFVFLDKEAQDPLERAQIDQIYVQAGVLLPNEVRADLGLADLPEQQAGEPQISGKEVVLDPSKPEGDIAAGPNALAPAPQAQATAPAPAEKMHLHKRDTSALTKPMRAIAEAMEVAFEDMRQNAVKAAGTLRKATADDGRRTAEDLAAWEGFAESFDTAPLSLAWDDLHGTITAVATNGARAQIAQIIADGELTSQEAHAAIQPEYHEVAPTIEGGKVVAQPAKVDLLSYRDPDAVQWADQHAAELLTKDGTGGELADATRNMLRSTLKQAVADKLSDKQIADLLERDYAFSTERAQLIARTEVRNAIGHGALAGAQRVGMQVKGWRVSDDEGPCPLCEANQAQGWIPIDNPFVSGAMAPLQHPRCRCSASYRKAPPAQ